MIVETLIDIVLDIRSRVKRIENALSQQNSNASTNVKKCEEKCDSPILTLDQAIEHCDKCINDSPCGRNHLRLKEWLVELKDYRNRYMKK